MKILLMADTDTNDIIHILAEQLDYEDLEQFIMELDDLVADWDFTEIIYNRYKKLHEDYLKEEEDEKAILDDPYPEVD